MKILLVTSFFPPTHTAGTEKRTFGYAKTLLERSHQVQVLCAGDWDNGTQYWNGHSDEIYRGIPVRRIHLNWQKSPEPNAYLYKNPLVYQRLRAWLMEWKPDLVHITSCITLSASIIAAAKELSVPVVLTLTDFWFICHKLSLLKYNQTLCDGITSSRDCIQCILWDAGVYRKLRKYTTDRITTQILNGISKIPLLSRQRGFRGMALNFTHRKAYLQSMLSRADVVTAPSNHLRNMFYRSGITKEIQVIQSGHDLSWLAKETPKIQRTSVRFGYIGQMIPTKGVHVLIEAFGAQNLSEKAELHLYGNQQADSVYYQKLQQVPTCNPEAVFYHGPFPHEDLGTILANIDVLVVPSLWHENNPRVIQEAFASKTPVIASDVGGIAEYVQHGVNGFLFPRGDCAELGAQIDRIANDPAQIEQLRAHIPAVKSIQAEMDEYELIYNQLVYPAEVNI